MKIKSKEIKSTDNDLMQLNRYIAHCGLCSRRKASELVKKGEITVNHFVIEDPSYRVKPKDVVRYKKQVIKPEEKIYILLNKPKNYVTTKSDPQGRKTVMDLLTQATKRRVYPVGRLDKDTTGLLLITNDGELTETLAHPKNKIKKVYHIELNRPLEEKDLTSIKRGIYLKDGKIKVDRIFFQKGRTKKSVGVEIHSGKKHVVRRLFSQIGYYVEKLNRVNFAGLTKRELNVGEYRYLSAKEIEKIKDQ